MKITHLEGIMVSEKYQGTGLSTEILRRAVAGSDVLAFHTQSKKMIGLARRVATEDLELAIEVADDIGTRNREGLIDVKRYGGSCLYGDKARFAESAIEEGDWQQGDARIFAGRVK